MLLHKCPNICLLSALDFCLLFFHFLLRLKLPVRSLCADVCFCFGITFAALSAQVLINGMQQNSGLHPELNGNTLKVINIALILVLKLLQCVPLLQNTVIVHALLRQCGHFFPCVLLGFAQELQIKQFRSWFSRCFCGFFGFNRGFDGFRCGFFSLRCFFGFGFFGMVAGFFYFLKVRGVKKQVIIVHQFNIGLFVHGVILLSAMVGQNIYNAMVGIGLQE